MVSARILVVEDEVIVTQAIAVQLRRLGYIVTATASSASQAIAMAIETQPDLVLMDILLKGKMDGIAAANQIREQLNIPVVYLSAFADNKTLDRAKTTKPFGYVIKPFNEKDLRVAIEIALYQHQMEQALRESQEQLATILQSMNDGVIATNQQGKITFINPAAEALTEWHLREAVDKDVTEIFQIFDEATGCSAPNPIVQVLQGEQALYQGDYKILITKNGNEIPIGHSVSPLTEKSGEISGTVVVFWDISQLRQTELLERSLKKEQEVNVFRSQFISTVSHEFRNPLSAVLTATELLTRYEEKITKEQKQLYLQRIKASVQRMTELMEDVLLIGQAESGRLEFNPTPLDLEQFCRDLTEELSLSEDSEQKIVLKIEGKYKEAWMDEKLLRYILVNLLSNALKYSPSGSTVEFELTAETEPHLAIFRIQDQGIGIPEEDQSQLFESFHRGRNVGKIAGTGLGLAIVRRCVERHQGEIKFTSTLEVGTTFIVKLPMQ